MLVSVIEVGLNVPSPFEAESVIWTGLFSQPAPSASVNVDPVATVPELRASKSVGCHQILGRECG